VEASPTVLARTDSPREVPGLRLPRSSGGSPALLLADPARSETRRWPIAVAWSATA